MSFPTKTATVTFKDLTNSTPAEAIQMATEENGTLVELLRELDEAVKIADEADTYEDEVAISLTREEFFAVRKALLADLEINNAILAAAHNATGESN